MLMPLPPTAPAEPLARIGRLARLAAVFPLLSTPEWRRVRRAQAVASPLAGPERATAMVPVYREVAGRTVRMAEAGDPSKPTVLFLSPFPFTILTFEPVWRELTEHAHLVAYDVPGLGKSPGGPEVMHYDVAARFLVELMDELDLRDVHLVGHDIPSAIVLGAAALNPVRIASLVIGDGPGIDVDATDLKLNGSAVRRFFAWGAPYRAMVGRMPAAVFLRMIHRLGNVRFQPSAYEVADQLEAYGGGRLKTTMAWFVGALAGIRSHVDPHLERLDLPVHVVWGVDDVVVFDTMGRELDRRLPRSTFTRIDAAGHVPWADQPETYAALLRSWIDDGHRRL
jgi:pimeloyl-ACP methyl ester carboxylesterase